MALVGSAAEGKVMGSQDDRSTRLQQLQELFAM